MSPIIDIETIVIVHRADGTHQELGSYGNAQSTRVENVKIKETTHLNQDLNGNTTLTVLEVSYVSAPFKPE